MNVLLLTLAASATSAQPVGPQPGPPLDADAGQAGMGAFSDPRRAATLLAELRALRLPPAEAPEAVTSEVPGATVSIAPPAVVSSSSCTKRTMANAAFRRGNTTTLFIGQGMDGCECSHFLSQACVFFFGGLAVMR